MPYVFTEDGLEMQIGTNVVGHYLLTLLLLPLLVKTSLLPEHAERSVRIVHVSSMGHKSPLSTTDWSSLEKVNQRGGRLEESPLGLGPAALDGPTGMISLHVAQGPPPVPEPVDLESWAEDDDAVVIDLRTKAPLVLG